MQSRRTIKSLKGGAKIFQRLGLSKAFIYIQIGALISVDNPQDILKTPGTACRINGSSSY